MDKQMNVDHDLLITLNTKVDQILLLQTDLVARIAKAEARLDANDVYHASIPIEHFRQNSEWVDSFRSNYKLIVAVIIIILTGLASVISAYVQKWLGIK